MFSSKAFRTAGLVALCLLMSGVFSGAWGGAQQQPLPQFQILPPPNGLPALGAVRSLDDGWPLAEVKECGTTIAQIFGVFRHRKDDGGDLEEIGGIRARENLTIGGMGPFPKGDYHIFLGHVEGVKFTTPQPPPELGTSWFMVMTDSQSKAVAVIVPTEPILAEELNGDEVLRALVKPNGLPSPGISAGLECCDLTVRHLSVTARKISPPCMVPPCPPPQWDIFALATVANIGQVDLTDPFTVRVLLNGRLIHEEQIAGLAKGASQPVLAVEMVDKPGLYIVTVMVDPDNKIKNERDETNNIAERSINIR